VKSPAQLFRLSSEFVFILLGGLLIWIAVTGRYLFNPRSLAWLLLAGLLAFYGLVTIRWRTGDRVIAWIRGGSLMLVGLVMLGLSHVTLQWVTPLLLLAGGGLAARGVIVSLLVLQSSPRVR
jgi:hypothetical protein